MNNIKTILTTIGILLAGLGNIISIGYGLYLWVIVDLTFKVSLWNGFIVWISMITLGLILIIIGTIF